MPVTPEQATAAVKLRAAFSHIETLSLSINAWLTPEQSAAMEAYRAAFGLKGNPAGELPVDASVQEVQLVKQFAARLEGEGVLVTPEDTAYATKLRLLQYLRARDLHLEKAYAMLLATLQWRRANKPWQLENTRSRTDKKASDARIVGCDPKGRIVVYSSFAESLHRSPHDVQVNSCATMEKAALLTNAGNSGELIWVNNFCARHKHGFGWRDCNPAFCFSGVEVFSNHYPESLKTMAIVDPPSIFWGLWNVVKPMLAPKTQEKAAFIDSREAKTKQLMLELFGEELGEFLYAQIRKDAK